MKLESQKKEKTEQRKYSHELSKINESHRTTHTNLKEDLVEQTPNTHTPRLLIVNLLKTKENYESSQRK